LLNFTRLRLSGFKSFVEPTELMIEPGLTGIVGPNGCGKSNIVEAVRWVMGETSAKQMRGGEMDDVIFGGTQDRPQRNIAEVQLTLDNRARTAPAQYNDGEEIEVVRRIERSQGSNYRINGRDMRARDVQLLFADAASGARSTALVSQGRISAIINAKPADRRALLEEAAGITGLHSRRHEAELRLRAAESNLERLNDVVVTMEAQLQSLKKQARQASRYRNLSDHIRRAEAMLLHLRWQEALGEVATVAEQLREVEQQVAEFTARVAAASTRQVDAAGALPPLRMAEAAAAAELHRYAVARDALDAEERRVADAMSAVAARLIQIASDTAREESLAADAADAIARLATEETSLASAQAQEAESVERARQQLDAANASLSQGEASLGTQLEEVAAAEARELSLESQRAEIAQRLARLEGRRREIDEERRQLEADTGVASALDEAKRAIESAAQAADRTRAAAERAEEARVAAQAAEAAARSILEAPEAARAKLAAEEKALAHLLGVDRPDMWPPVIDSLTVAAGYELALAAALGDDLTAPLDEGAPFHWRALPPLENALPLPDGARPLAEFVSGPTALARRLSQTGLVADEATGRAIAARLAPGQRLVTREGAFWRWDGFTIAAGAPTTAAKRLGQRNRLDEVRNELAAADQALATARGALAEAQETSREALMAERRARDDGREAEAAHHAARDAERALAQRVAGQSSRLAALEEASGQLEIDRADASRLAEAARSARAELPDLDAARRRLEETRAAVTERRARQRDAQSAFDRLAGEAEGRRQRLATIARERGSAEMRAEAAQRQLAELAQREQASAAERQGLAAKPAEITAQRSTLLETIAKAEAKRREAADRLASAETQLSEADQALKSAEGDLHAAREDRVRREGSVAAAEQTRVAIVERIAERLNCAPEETFALAEHKAGEDLPPLAAIEQRFQRLVNERETMGPVNLVAETEADEVGAQIESLQTERADLVGAIARLRQGIAELNREGRERLLASFEAVNGHFTQLFTRLFGGGRAHLQLTESDDPLEAGLEIMASPPGKKLQILSLLSGGEQALTALSLLFAVFMTNPAPICVMDEVDAPLDDANVDRFCTLLDEIARHSSTRFLLITHHRMTMARMDRLFGVTMPERGVSQLVSVDLAAAESMRATA
jgi:chromosome segregation protein